MNSKAEDFVQQGMQKAKKNDLQGASTDLFKAVDIFQKQGRLEEAQQVLEIIKQLQSPFFLTARSQTVDSFEVGGILRSPGNSQHLDNPSKRRAINTECQVVPLDLSHREIRRQSLDDDHRKGLFSTLCDNQCLSFVGVLLGKALKTMFLENYPYPSSFHTETRRAISLFRQFSQS
jgi:hypothetical protein